jgi:hypothetical protein
LPSLNQLEHILTPEARWSISDWAERVRCSLAGVQEDLRRHAEATDCPLSPLTDQDRNRAFQDRQASRLRRELVQLLEQTTGLENEARCVLEACRGPVQPPESLTTQPPGGTGNPVAEVGLLHRHAQSLLEAVRHHMASETELLLESIYWDIGTGD